jgi:hypothetical protein
MNPQFTWLAGWAANISGVASILGLVFQILCFSLESTPSKTQPPHFWGPISDIAPILQMGSMLVVLRAFWLGRVIQRQPCQVPFWR